MLRAVTERGDSVQKQTGNGSREMGTPRKNQHKMLEIKHPLRETKGACHGLTSRLAAAQERIGVLEKLL